MSKKRTEQRRPVYQMMIERTHADRQVVSKYEKKNYRNIRFESGFWAKKTARIFGFVYTKKIFGQRFIHKRSISL